MPAESLASRLRFAEFVARYAWTEDKHPRADDGKFGSGGGGGQLKLPKPGSEINLDGAKYWAEPFDGDDSFPPAIAEYEVRGGYIKYTGRTGTEGIVTGTQAQAKQWMAQVDRELQSRPAADTAPRDWQESDGGQENVQQVIAMAAKAAKAFGIEAPQMQPSVAKRPLASGSAGSNTIKLANPHLRTPNTSLNFATKVPYESHVAAHEVAHLAFSANPDAARRYMGELSAAGKTVSAYHSQAGHFEGMMELGAAYVHSPQELKAYSPKLFDIAHRWASEVSGSKESYARRIRAAAARYASQATLWGDQTKGGSQRGLFDEAKHPRADDGKFGQGGGGDTTTKTPAQPKAPAKPRKPRAKAPPAKPQTGQDQDMEGQGQGTEQGPGEQKPPARAHQTETPQFKTFFGKSQCVDKDGKPLRVLHGTRVMFTKFKANYGTHIGRGFYFAEVPEISNTFTGAGAYGNAREATGGNTIPCYLCAENPLRLDEPWSGDPTEWEIVAAQISDEYGRDFDPRNWALSMKRIQHQADTMKRPLQTGEVYFAMKDHLGADRVNEAMAKLGYDSITHLAGDKSGTDATYRDPARPQPAVGRVWVMFDSGRCKSAIGNKGTFDRTNPDIRYAMQRERLAQQFRELYARQMSLWDEAKHPRADDGRFGEKSGDHGKAEETDGPELTPAEKKERKRKATIVTDRFKRWFGDWAGDPGGASKVVKESGEPEEQYRIPTKVFHGTLKGGFRAFDPKKASPDGLYGPGFYFTEDVGIARQYMGQVIKSDYLYIEVPKENREAFLEDYEKTMTAEGWNLADLTKGTSISVSPVVKQMWADSLRRFKATGQLANFASSDRERQEIVLDIASRHGAGIPEGESGEPVGKVEHPMELKEVYLNIRNPFDIEGSHSTAEIARKLFDADPYILLRLGYRDAQQALRDDKNWEPKFEDVDKKLAQLGWSVKNPDGTTKKTADGKLAWELNGDSLYGFLSQGNGGRATANKILEEIGFDGITHKGGSNIGTRSHKVWIAFKPNQVKSVDSEKFDPNEDDMYRRRFRQAELVQRYAQQFREHYEKQLGLFDESKHPRAEDGRFGEKSGEHEAKDDSKGKLPAKPEPPKLTPAEEKAAKRAKKITGTYFKRWFGDWKSDPANSSKVVKANGEPQETARIPSMVYHGTAHGGFRAFDAKKSDPDGLYGPGFYFTEDESVAREYMTGATSNSYANIEIPPAHRAAFLEAYRSKAHADGFPLIDEFAVGTFGQRAEKFMKWGKLNYIGGMVVGSDQMRSAVSIADQFGAALIGTRGKQKGKELGKLEVKQAYLNIRNPIDMDAEYDPLELADKFLKSKGHLVSVLTGEQITSRETIAAMFQRAFKAPMKSPAEGKTTGHQLFKTLAKYNNSLGTENKTKALDMLQKMGFDGITHTGGAIMGNREHKVWIAFKPNQVKSVDSEAFDPNDDDMYYRRFERAVAVFRYAFNEADHPRAADGRFGEKAGAHAGPRKPAKGQQAMFTESGTARDKIKGELEAKINRSAARIIDTSYGPDTSIFDHKLEWGGVDKVMRLSPHFVDSLVELGATKIMVREALELDQNLNQVQMWLADKISKSTDVTWENDPQGRAAISRGLQEKFREYFEGEGREALGSANRSSALHQANYSRDMQESLGHFSSKVHERIDRSCSGGMVAYNDTESLTSEWETRVGSRPQFELGGFFSADDKTIHNIARNGYTEVYAHEFGHAIDWNPRAGWEYSGSEEWGEAFQKEIATAESRHAQKMYGPGSGWVGSKPWWEMNEGAVPLSIYATQSTEEGFAEFARAVFRHGKAGTTDTLKKAFPLCYDFWEKRGLVAAVDRYRRALYANWDESKHPRADDGKFGEGGHTDERKVKPGPGQASLFDSANLGQQKRLPEKARSAVRERLHSMMTSTGMKAGSALNDVRLIPGSKPEDFTSVTGRQLQAFGVPPEAVSKAFSEGGQLDDVIRGMARAIQTDPRSRAEIEDQLGQLFQRLITRPPDKKLPLERLMLDEERASFHTKMAGTLDTFTDKAHERIERSLPNGMDVHATTDILTSRYCAEYGRRLLPGQQVGGYFNRDKGLLVNAADGSEGTYAHELAHAIDYDRNTGDFTYSSSKEWDDVWRSEMMTPYIQKKYDAPDKENGWYWDFKDDAPLSAYALSEPSEGFAEFGRALHEYGADYCKTRFPKCTEYWKKQGLVAALERYIKVAMRETARYNNERGLQKLSALLARI